MPDMELPANLVFVRSTSAASLPACDSTALGNNLAGMMKNGVFLVVEPPMPKRGTEQDPVARESTPLP
jgi:hypothetical protein